MHNYICNKCSKEFQTRKNGQTYCSKSCANSVNTTKRKINSISAYILGIILSDGCLSYDAHSHRYRITITMNDYSLIKYLRDNYSPEKKIYEYKHKIGRGISYTFITTNEFDINYLIKLGVVERKSNIYEFAKGILDVLKKADIRCSLLKDSRKDNNCWYVKIYSREGIKNLYKYMYNYSSIYLDRKRDLFKVMI